MQPAQPAPIRQVRYIMGTECASTVYPADGTPQARQTAEAAIKAAFDELKRIDQLLSNWKADSELMHLNRAASAVSTTSGERPWVKVSAELFERVQVALLVSRNTGGRFDPTVGPLVRAWGFLPECPPGTECNASPATSIAEKVKTAKDKVGWEKVKLDEASHSIQFAVPGMEIDLGGIAKGYAAGRAARVLWEQDVRSALVDLGNSSMSAIGTPPMAGNCDARESCATGWPIAIRDPRNRASAAAAFYLRDGESLATSSTYEHTQGSGSGKRSHIIDPRSGEALAGDRSVTVILRDAELADALTKPFLLLRSTTNAQATGIRAAYPEAGVILLTPKGGGLETTIAGPLPYRFRSELAEVKQNTRSGQKHLSCCKKE